MRAGRGHVLEMPSHQKTNGHVHSRKLVGLRMLKFGILEMLRILSLSEHNVDLAKPTHFMPQNFPPQMWLISSAHKHSLPVLQEQWLFCWPLGSSCLRCYAARLGSARVAWKPEYRPNNGANLSLSCCNGSPLPLPHIFWSQFLHLMPI